MGRYTLLLAGRGLRMTGLDLSSVLLDRLLDFNAGKHDLALVCADVETPPAELLGTFDAVVGFFTLHHLVDVERSMHGVRALLKPGGRVVFLEPNPLNPLYYLQVTFTPGMSWSAERGMLRMRPGPIAGAMAAAGLGDFGFERFGFLPPFLANLRWGGRAEAALERFPWWRANLPFQLFRGRVP
jgi:SAM-dependent methyltransferase